MVGHAPATFVAKHHPELMTPRDDVFCARAGRISGKLKPGFGSREHSCGMELMMGKALGDAVENPILFVKSCTGGTTLHRDWRPPGAVKRAGGQIGSLYTRMIGRFHNVLANLELHIPGAKDRGYPNDVGQFGLTVAASYELASTVTPDRTFRSSGDRWLPSMPGKIASASSSTSRRGTTIWHARTTAGLSTSPPAKRPPVTPGTAPSTPPAAWPCSTPCP